MPDSSCNLATDAYGCTLERCSLCTAGIGHDAGSDSYAWWEDDTLGPCGCTDYHLADCPTRTGGTGMTAEDAYRMAYYRQAMADAYGDDPSW